MVLSVQTIRFLLQIDNTNIPVIIDQFPCLHICAWTLGFITPGAPGGIGVRESIIVAMLSGTIDPQAALVGALLFRLVTVLGEFLGFIFASTLLRPSSISTD